MKTILSIHSMLLATFAFCNELPIGLAQCSTPPAVSDSEITKTCTWDDLGYKIHGKNGQKDKFKCKSFEGDLAEDMQYNALKYGYFSKFSYYGKSDSVNNMKSHAKTDASEYKLLDGAELEKILSGTTMMAKDGSIISRKDEHLYDKDDAKGKLDGHSEAGSTRFDAKIFVKRDENDKN